MKRLLLTFLLACASAYGQISGAGQIGCSGAPTTGTVVNNATSNNTDLVVFTNFPAYGMLVQLNQTTTVTAGAITFQVSSDGGTNYITAPVVLNVATGAALTNPYTLVASTNQAFLVVLGGASNFKVRLTTAMTGSGTITPFVTPICTIPAAPLVSDSSGNVKVNVNVALPSGTNLMGKVGIDQTTPGTTNGVRADTSGATGAAPPVRADFLGGLGSGATGGFTLGVTVCDSDKSVNVSTATTTLMVTGVSGRQVRICSFDLLTTLANNVAFLEGTGATCGTGTAGMTGGTTAASGYNFAANSGIAKGSGFGEVLTTVTTGDSVCIITSAATQLSGHIKYAIY